MFFFFWVWSSLWGGRGERGGLRADEKGRRGATKRDRTALTEAESYLVRAGITFYIFAFLWIRIL